MKDILYQKIVINILDNIINISEVKILNLSPFFFKFHIDQMYVILKYNRQNKNENWYTKVSIEIYLLSYNQFKFKLKKKIK